MIFDIMSRMIAWIISCMFWSIRCECWSIISTLLNEKKIIKCNDFLWFLNASEWRFFNFSNMTFEISFRLFSNSESFSNDSVKFWKDSEKFWKDLEKFRKDSFASMLLSWAIDYFSLFFRKKIWADCIFDDKFFDNLNDILISFLNDLLFLKNVFEIVDLMNWDVLDVFEISINDLFFFYRKRFFFLVCSSLLL
jgi:hypothetical protein